MPALLNFIKTIEIEEDRWPQSWIVIHMYNKLESVTWQLLTLYPIVNVKLHILNHGSIFPFIALNPNVYFDLTGDISNTIITNSLKLILTLYFLAYSFTFALFAGVL